MLPRGFSWKYGLTHFAIVASSCSSAYVRDAFYYLLAYELSRGRPEPRQATLLRHPIGNNVFLVVQEYQPAVHRLRLPASP